MVTLIARVTYELRPVRCVVCARPEPVRTSDRWVEGDRGQSTVHEPSDLAPMKEAADVVLVGKAHAPRDGPPVVEVAARMVIGEIDKTLRVTGPRRHGRDGAALAPAPFREAPIDWSRTSGGPGTWNPAGVGEREVADVRGETLAPTVLPYGIDAPPRGTYVAPAGFGPIAPSWAPRADAAAPGAREWIDPEPGAQLTWNAATRPAFFQCAPADQRLARPIRSDERIVLENLLAAHARLVTNLPGRTLRAVVVDEIGEPRPIELGADTLWIDADRAIATVTYRAALPARVVEGRDVAIWLEAHDADGTDGDEEEPSATSLGRGTVEIPADFGGDPERTSLSAPTAPRGAAVTPFTRPGAPTPFTRPSVPPAQPLSAPPMAQPLGAPPLAPPAPPAQVPPPLAVLSPSGPVAARAEWTPSTPAPPAAAQALDTRKLHEQAAARRGADEPLLVTATSRSEASTPAAAAAPATPATRPAAVEVVWFDGTTEIAAASRSRTLLEQLGTDDDQFLSAKDEGGTLEIARRDVGRWFRRAAPIEPHRLPELLGDALADEAGTRPFVVLAGELAWSFDPRESLRAWIALGTPLVVDSRVKDAIENAERAMAENLVSVPDVLVAALERLRDAVRANAKLIGQTPIDAAAERWLVEERGFAKRRVWGQVRLRAHLHAARARAPIPVYLPDGAGWEAPLSQRFAARVLGEIRIRQDPTEAATVCLRAIALGADFTP